MLLKNADLEGNVVGCTTDRSALTGEVVRVNIVVEHPKLGLRRTTVFGKNLSVLVMDEVQEGST